MPQPPSPLIPHAIWPRVQDLFFDLVERTSREVDERLLEEEADVRYWVKELLEAEPFDVEPINFREELSALRVGTVVGTRYRLERFLGMGGFGDVYEALDQVTDETVAVKLVPESPDDGTELREWATLRVIDVPGVVSLIDTCHEEDCSVLVMPLLEGTPFPGRAELDLEELRECTISLLESLERLHAAGFVHGDLKPGNVLVDDGGRPSILDLGVAQRWRRPAFLGLDRIAVSPEYAAPELLRGERATPSADLYSLGVMLYEALTGEVPSLEATGGSLGRVPFASLRKVRPELQNDDLATLVDGLLGFSPRLESATQALALLGRGTLEDRLRQHVGRLGSPEEIEDLVHALRLEEPVEVIGGRQSGKTHLLEELERSLSEAGERVIRLAGDVDKILHVLCTPAEIATLGSWENLRSLVVDRLREGRESGSFLLIDDFDQLKDADLTDAVLALNETGRVLLARTRPLDEPSSALAPLDQSALETLFEGPNVILHLREDAAKELHTRTRGLRGRVIRELAAWIRAGLATLSESGKIAVPRGCLHRLTHAIPGPLRAPSSPALSLTEVEARMLAIGQLFSDGITQELWSELSPDLVLHLESNVSRLLERGALEEQDGRFFVTSRIPLSGSLSPRDQERIHAKVADSLAMGDSRRVRLRVLAGDPEGAVDAALEVGLASLEQGQPTVAFSALLEGLRNLDHQSARSPEPLLAELTEAALALQSVPAIQRALHEVELALDSLNGRTDLPRILNLALRLQAHDPARVLSELENRQPMVDTRWQRWFATLISHASHVTGEPHLREEASQILTELSQRGDARAARELAVLLGLEHYSKGNTKAAISFRTQVVSLSTDPARRCAGLISLAVSQKEFGQWNPAQAALDEAQELATKHRFSMLEARCWWLRSSLAYRRGQPEAVCEETVAATAALGLRSMAAQLHLTEAARTWRAGELEAAQVHANQALKFWSDAPGSPGYCVAHALAIAAGAEASEAAVEQLLEISSELPLPGAALQAAALISSVFPRIVSQNEALMRSMDRAVALFAPKARSLRREVLSVSEAARLLSGKKV